MKVIQLLNEYPFILLRIKELDATISDLTEQIETAKENPISAIKLTGMPHSSTVSDSVANLVQKIITMQLDGIEKCLKIKVELINKQIFVENLIAGLTNRERLIINLRHFDGLTFWQIGRHKNIQLSKSRTWAMHKEIIDKLDKFLEKEDK